MIESALLLATLDPIFRVGLGHEAIGSVHKLDIQDLRNLIVAVDNKVFKAKKLCIINPTFGTASSLVGGADADLVIDDCLIDIKTTQNLSMERETFNQVLGYYVLHHIAGIDGARPKPNIKKIAIYFSRYAYLHIMPLSEIVNMKTFPKFVRWFKQKASKKY